MYVPGSFLSILVMIVFSISIFMIMICIVVISVELVHTPCMPVLALDIASLWEKVVKATQGCELRRSGKHAPKLITEARIVRALA